MARSSPGRYHHNWASFYRQILNDGRSHDIAQWDIQTGSQTIGKKSLGYPRGASIQWKKLAVGERCYRKEYRP